MKGGGGGGGGCFDTFQVPFFERLLDLGRVIQICCPLKVLFLGFYPF